LVLLLNDDTAVIAKDASMALINISGDEEGSSALLIIAETFKCTAEDKSDNLIDLCFR